MVKRRIVFFVVIGVFVVVSVDCNSESGLFVSGGNPPSFEIGRSRFAEVRIFPIFIVHELHPDNEKVGPLQEEYSKNRIVWKIVVDHNRDVSVSEKIEKIEYAKIPDGFKQEIPAQGPPEPLRENQMYEAQGPLSLMVNAVVRFKIADGKITTYPLP